MAAITIRNIDDSLKARLRVRAAEHSRSMEEEVRHILRAALGQEAAPRSNLADMIKRRFAPMGGAEIASPDREVLREAPSFEA